MYPFLLKLFADGGYQGPQFADGVAKCLPQLAVEIVKRSDQAKGFEVLPMRWVVERTLAWLNRCRRLAKDFEHLTDNALAFLRLASIRLMLRRLYGVSAWGLRLDASTKQQGLIITRYHEPEITTDDIEVAQFLYLLIHNEKLRRVIDTITSKVVLILGRFSEERQPVVDAMRNALRERDLLPIIFDFSIPASRDVTETVKVLAGLASFVIADITDATEVRVELHGIVPLFPSLAVQPILLRGQPEFISVQNLRRFPWVLPSFEYDTTEHLLANLNEHVVAPAEAKVRELQRPQPPAPEAG
jgi:transposase